MTDLPRLYKKNSTGSVQYWSISVAQEQEFGKISIEYGQLDTQNPQFTSELIKSGKNIGKKNETTTMEQTHKEALAKWEKQKKSGYVESMEEAERGDVDSIIEGGVLPMLAHKYDEQAHKIKFPAMAQPKLDGIRTICIVKSGKASLWSRTRKPIYSCPHIIAEIEKEFVGEDIILDGELYNHQMKNDFEEIVSLVRKKEAGVGHEAIQYHVYDMINEEPFYKRSAYLHQRLTLNHFEYVKLVETVNVRLEVDLQELFKNYLHFGYEGAMVRNVEGLYVNKRSYDLQKVKTMMEGEFPIIGIKEGKGKLAGHAIFVCSVGGPGSFITCDVKLDGKTSYLKELFENPNLWKNKLLTVQYQGFTSDNNLRFPVGKAIRDYE